MELKSAISLLLLVTALSGCWGNTVHQHKYDLGGSDVKEPEEEGKIIGGSELRVNQWPFLVLVLANDSGTLLKWCGGSIIDNTHVLSAAHCFEDSDMTYSIVAGEHNASANEGTEQTRKVLRVFNHPNYTRRHYQNDVAVLRLDSPLQLNNRVTTVFFNDDNTCPVVNATCSVSGWGRTIEGDRNSASKVPLTVEVPIQPQSKCSNVYTAYSNKQICAGNNGHDSCQGDSGGPLMCLCGGMNQLTGIVSYGTGCGREAFPGVYTRVSSHLNWFVEVVNGVHDNRADTYNYHHQENVDV